MNSNHRNGWMSYINIMFSKGRNQDKFDLLRNINSLNSSISANIGSTAYRLDMSDKKDGL